MKGLTNILQRLNAAAIAAALLAVLVATAGTLCAQDDAPLSASEANPQDKSPRPLEDILKEHREAQARKEASDTSVAEATNIEDELTFSEIRRRMMQEQAVPITPPRGSARTAEDPQTDRRKRPRLRFKDGQGMVDKLVVVDRDEMGWLAATFLRSPRDGAGNLPTARLLQCPLLASLEEVLKEQPDVLFQISAEVRLFQNEAYLMLRRAAIWEGERPASAGRVEAVATVPASSQAENAAVQTNDTQQDDNASEAVGDGTGSTDDLMSAMMADQPGRALPPPEASDEPDASEAEESVAPINPKPLPAGERDLIADRTVRIVQSADGRWWEARFVGDNTLREPPMRVLPGGLLSKAIALMSQVGEANKRFRITGEVLRYKGRRYLLLRKLLPERDMGQF